MDIADISDGASLERWLRTQPTSVSIQIAKRTALRVAPIFGSAVNQPWARASGGTALNVMHPILIAVVAQQSGLPAIARSYHGRALPPATQAAAFAGFSAEEAISAAKFAAHTSDAVSRIKQAAARAAARSANSAANATVTYDGVELVWEQIRDDLRMISKGKEVVTARLWSTPLPDWFKRTYRQMREIWSTDPPGTWDFWLRWWDGVLSGNQVNLDLQRDIVLGLADEDWEGGPARVAARIAEIEARYQKTSRLDNLLHLEAVIAENPYAWRISFDVPSQTFSASAIEKRDMSDILVSVRNSIKRLNQRCKKMGIGNFGQSVQLAFEPIIVDLRSDLRAHASSPLSLLVSIERARNEMEDIARKEHFITESFLTRFFLELQSAGEDICVAAPEIVEQLKKKAAVRFELYSLERKQQMMAQTFGLHLSAEGILKSVALESLRILGDDTAAKEDKQQAWYFATAVLPRAARAYLAETAEAEDEVMQPTKASTAKRIVDAADALSKLDKGKDVLVENVPALADLVQSIVASLPPT